MAYPAKIQEAAGTSSTTSVSATFGAAPKVGDLLVAVVWHNGNGVGLTSMSGWNLLIEEVIDASSQNDAISMWTRTADGSETGAQTATGMTGSTNARIYIAEWNGVETTAYDSGSVTSGTTTSLSATVGGSGFNVETPALVIAACATANGAMTAPYSVTADADEDGTLANSDSRLLVAQHIVGSGGGNAFQVFNTFGRPNYTANITWSTTARRYGSVFASWKAERYGLSVAGCS